MEAVIKTFSHRNLMKPSVGRQFMAVFGQFPEAVQLIRGPVSSRNHEQRHGWDSIPPGVVKHLFDLRKGFRHHIVKRENRLLARHGRLSGRVGGQAESSR